MNCRLVLRDINFSVTNRKLVLTEQPDCFGENLPFCFFHDTALEGFGGIALEDGNSLLEDNGAAVTDFIDEVDGCTGDLYTLLSAASWTWSP